MAERIVSDDSAHVENGINHLSMHYQTAAKTNGIQTVSGRDGVESHDTATDGISTSDQFSPRSSEDEKLLLAVTYVEDAVLGRTLPYRTDKGALQSYRTYSNWIRHSVAVFCLWFNLCLALFEDPAVPGLALPNWATMLMEVACLTVFAARLWRLSTFVPRNVFLHDPKNIVVVVTITFTLIDMIVYIGMINSPASSSAIRVSRVVRPLFLVNMNESRQIRRAFRNIRNTVPEILSVLVLFFFSIALFSLMAFKFFENRDLYYRIGGPYFRNYWDSYWDLYVLVTTANSPDVMMPAYDYSPWFAIFFIIYIVINTYIFMNLFLAVIYNSYRAHLKEEITKAVREKRKKLAKAFDLLKDSASAVPCITLTIWKKMMKKVASMRKDNEVLLLWYVLADVENESGISEKSFLSAADALNVRLVVDRRDTNVFERHCHRVYSSAASRVLIKGVNHRFFVYIFDLLIMANAVCIALNLETTEWFFLPIFMLEIVLRIYAVGPMEYFSFDHLWNWFDFIIILAAFIATIIEASLDELDTFPREALDVLLVLRCLRLVKITGNIERFRTVIMTIVNIAPSLLTYGGVLLMVFYAFAIIGMEAFGGRIHFNEGNPYNCSNDKLIDSEFSRMGYCQINFNNIIHSLVTLFVLMVVNQWHVITQGYVLITSKAARLFFITFHLTVVILILNIIVAFVLEAFILEYTIKHNKMEQAIESKIEELQMGVGNHISGTIHDRTELVASEGTDIPGYTERQDRQATRRDSPNYRFRVNKGHKNIEVLLQRMFELDMTTEEAPATDAAETKPMSVQEITLSDTAI